MLTTLAPAHTVGIGQPVKLVLRLGGTWEWHGASLQAAPDRHLAAMV